MPNKRHRPSRHSPRISAQRKSKQTSWQDVGSWYTDTVGEQGHYYHQHVVLPGILKLLGLTPGNSLLDVACGQGVLGRQVSADIEYVGIDHSTSLIEYAKTHDASKQHRYVVGDVTKPFPVDKRRFSHAAIILALQNIEQPEHTLVETAAHLAPHGRLVTVLNHPCFRIPRQSSWGIDEKQHLQYRRMNVYMSPLSIPIVAHPSKGKRSATTWSFHRPLSAYSAMLADAGFMIERLEEWISDKKSEGGAAARENRSRKEFPLFLAIQARKVN